MQNNSACDLCGLPVGAATYTLYTVTKQAKHFCCDGCKGIYQMLHEDQVMDENRTKEPN